MKISLSHSARCLRERAGISQREAAGRLGVSSVHLCNIENGRSQPSPDLMERMEEVYGVNLYVFAWLESGDTESLPLGVRNAAKNLRTYFADMVTERLNRGGT